MILSEDQHVRVEKVDKRENPDYEPHDWEDYIEGADNPGGSLPIEYSVKGTLLEKPQEGRSLLVDRYQRNGESSLGFMRTSPIDTIIPCQEWSYVLTQNSVYKITEVDDER